MDDAAAPDHHRIESVLIPAERIRERIRELAADIARDYPGPQPLRVVGVLKGAFVFLADLGRELRRAGAPPLQFDIIRARTYDGKIKQPGERTRPVELELMPDDLKGQDVLLVEDILDQGFTLRRLVHELQDRIGVRTLALCVLLDKQLDDPTEEVLDNRRELASLERCYRGFAIPDRWVAGYGLDVDERFREWPDIVVVQEPQRQTPEG